MVEVVVVDAVPVDEDSTEVVSGILEVGVTDTVPVVVGLIVVVVASAITVKERKSKFG